MRPDGFRLRIGLAVLPVLALIGFSQAGAQSPPPKTEPTTTTTQPAPPAAQPPRRPERLPNAPTDEVNRPPVLDPYDRLSQLWYRKRFADSGVLRGQEIYYMSCWMCHNEYTIAADPQGRAPSLKDLFKPGSGVTDAIIIGKIRAPGLRMPGYPASVLTDDDLKDLLAYLRSKCGTFPTENGGGGCYDENNPPANPLYKGGD